MLLQLSIQNFALIRRLSIDFEAGLNVLTGETGAGKSILIDALRIVLGERAGGDIFLERDKNCIIEAAFSVPEALRMRSETLRGFLQEGDECLILRREISPEGRSKNYVNRQFVNASFLRDLSALIIDFHGQYDQQHIFESATHLEMVDRLAGLRGGKKEPVLAEYRTLYDRYSVVIRRQKELQDAAQGKQRQMDLLSYQIDEIEKIDPEADEEDELAKEKIRLGHAQKLHDLSREILEALDESEDSATSRLGQVFRPFFSWVKIDPAAEAMQKQLEEVQIGLEELVRSVRDYQESLTFDESRLSEAEERLDSLERLKRKYGGSIREVLEFLTKAKQEYDELLNSEVYQHDLERELQKILPELETRAKDISAIRKKAAAQLKKEVEAELHDLGISHAEFDTHFSKTGFGPQGAEQVEFLFSPNPGHGLKPLVKIASGGEASRILLALKRALAKVDDIPVLIFDEIDANIGGRLGDVVGRKLREIADERQILLITHLPQIASFAARHYKVSKGVSKGRTEVHYELLKGEAKVRELAQMMSGVKETEISRSHAEEMLKSAGK